MEATVVGGKALVRTWYALIWSLLCATPLAADLAGSRPNVVLIMGDDIGFSDIGPYGSEIETPHLNDLAERGLRFTQFYNMAKCETTRTTLFTGLYLEKRHAANAQNLAGLLRSAGYFTAMVGKEHFSPWVPEGLYAVHHFDRSLTYRVINQYFVPPDGEWQSPFFLDGAEISHHEMPVREPPFYKTDVLTDYAIEFLDGAVAAEKPFFLYLPYHAAHYPLQARPEDIARYRGKYRIGWDRIRRDRLARAIGLGVVAEGTSLSPAEGNVNRFRGPYRRGIYDYRPWRELDAKQRDALDLEMAVFAAMVHRLDRNIGRVIAALDRHGVRENTLIIYLSDNGSCPYDSNRDFAVPPGGADSYRTLSAAWANAGNTPFRYYKQYGHEGGGHTHFIATWPGRVEPRIVEAPGHVADVLPTLLELAGASYPPSVDRGPTPRLDGESLVPVLAGRTRRAPALMISGFTERFRGVRMGDQKIVRLNGEGWQLFDLASDPTETNDLAVARPDEVRTLVGRYRAWLADQGALSPLADRVEPD